MSPERQLPRGGLRTELSGAVERAKTDPAFEPRPAVSPSWAHSRPVRCSAKAIASYPNSLAICHYLAIILTALQRLSHSAVRRTDSGHFSTCQYPNQVDWDASFGGSRRRSNPKAAELFCNFRSRTSLLRCRIPARSSVTRVIVFRSATVCACRLLKAMSISTSVTDGCGNSGE
ncbi:hypothetical protein BV898_01163 [Hypsibius exemplaris]|uniref:Uncharacterized protein n=1 Tax=Hypsibius exemplaris TaxID=2072580 RepID=A0A1W0XBS2_HYPEX|nr:hypothetical protein BV898_01163 [Hypsibius exemplaris]